MQALADPDAGLLELAKIVEQDVAISAKLLQAVNSAFFGLPRRVASVQRAVSCLGVNLLKNLVLSLEVARAFAGAFPPDFSLEAQQAHALLAANIARDLVPEKQHADDAFTAALLHDVGILVMATRMTEHFGRVLATVRESGRPMHQVEAELSAVTHAQIGAYLLGLWGLPYGVVEAVAHHHTPAAVDHGQFDVVDVVHVASHLAHGQVDSSTPHPESTNETLDVAHLERLGVADRLPAWRAKADEHARRSAGDMT
jgi:HD-like signal output (HDOD) protein